MREAQRPPGSYTTSLFEGGIRRIAQKVGEEGWRPLWLRLRRMTRRCSVRASDLLYHLLVLLRARGLSLDDARAVLEKRHR